jgi:serine/threonine-protein kinase
MGVVFKAQDQKLDEVVALKFLRVDPTRKDLGPTDLERVATLASRLRSEIKLAWKVRHRNVCGIHEYGEDGDLLFISMEFVDGRDLRRILREKVALIWEEACDVALQVAEGLAAIHDAGIIHRDLKPANIMLDAKDVVRLMDFGIAKVWTAESGSGITSSSHVVGSPEYMSPEQVRDWALDFRSDLYSLGVVLYELVTGSVPFRAETPVATMLKHVEEPPPLDGPRAARIPSALLPILRRALTKEPDGRYASCDEMRRALKRARDGLPSQRTDPVPPPRPPLPPEWELQHLLVPWLSRALKHGKPVVRRDAAEALGNIRTDRAQVLAALWEAVERDDDPGVRAAAQAALAQLELDQAARGRAPLPVCAPSVLAPPPTPASPPPSPPTAPTPPWTPAPRSVSQQPKRLPAIDTSGDRPPRTRSRRAILAGAAAVLALLLAVAIRVIVGGRIERDTHSPATALPTTTPSIDPPQPSPTSPIGTTPPTSSVPTTSPAVEPSPSPTHARPRGSFGRVLGGRASQLPLFVPSPVASPALETTTTTTTQPVSESPPSIEAIPASPVPIPSPPPPPRVQAGDLVQLTDPGVVPPKAKTSNAAAHTMISLELAERFGLKGSVELRVLVDENGEVVKVDVLSVTTRPEGAEYERALKDAAVKGASKWRFDPARSAGVVVRVWLPVRIEF